MSLITKSFSLLSRYVRPGLHNSSTLKEKSDADNSSKIYLTQFQIPEK